MRESAAWKSGTGAKRRVRSPKGPAARTSAVRRDWAEPASGLRSKNRRVSPGRSLAGGADEGAPEIFGGVGGGDGGLGFGLGCDLFGEEDFDEAGWLGRAGLRARAGAGGEEARGQDAGVVENEEIAGLEELREVGEEVVAECSGGAVEDQHTAGAALGGRVLGDEFGGKIVMEVGDEHRVGAGEGHRD